MSDEQNSFAMRHRARRAALLADLLREQWDGLGDEWAQVLAHMDLPEAAARLSEQGWINATDEIARRTGEPFRPPSETTKAITIGLLSAPALRGLVH